MNIETLSILSGTTVCNARCPYCISKMTPTQGISLQEPIVNWRNFRKACLFAHRKGVTTALITGKGEPTLFPEQVTRFLQEMKEFEFPIIELQTNGIILEKEYEKYEKHLKEWHELGLDTIALSIVHYTSEKNKAIYTPHTEYIDLENLIKRLHKIGYSVRLSCTMVKGFTDSVEEAKKMIDHARNWKVEQLSLRKLAMPQKSESQCVYMWSKNHVLPEADLQDIKEFLQEKGKKLATLAHGAVIYDVDGQNVCLTDALTIEPDTDNIRQLIFFPDGHLRFDWQFKGAIVL